MFRLLILAYLFLLPTCLYADWQPFSINYTVKDGLPTNECYYVITDKKGYIWVATDYGISCFNGRKFTNYIKELLEKSIILIRCDDKNRIWFVSSNGIFGYIENGKVHYPKASLLLKEHLKIGNVVSLDFNDKGDLFIGTTVNLFKVSRAKNYSTITEVFKRPTSNNASYPIIKQIRNKGWISSWNRSIGITDLSHKDRLGLKQIPFKFIGRDSRFEYNFDSSNKNYSSSQFQYLETTSGDSYLIYLNYMVHFSNKKTTLKEYNDNLHFLYEDSARNLFVTTTANGVFLFKGGLPHHFLHGKVVGSMTQDKSGGYWFTTTQNGLYYIPYLNVSEFSQTKEKLVKRVRFLNDRFYVILEKDDLYHWDTKNDQLVGYEMEELRLLQKNAVVDILLYDQGLLFRSVLAGVIHKGNQRVRLVRTRDKAITTPLFGLIKYGKSYLTVGGSDVLRLDGNQATFLKPVHGRSTCIFLNEKNNRIFVGTRSGLYSYNYQKNSIKPFHAEIFRNDYITMIKALPNGYLLVATKNNGFYFQTDSGWKHLTEKEGLLSDLCKEFYVLKGKTVIMLMHGGINYFHLDRPDKIYHLSFLEGLFSDEILCLELHDKDIYIGYGEGLLRFPISFFFEKEEKENIYLAGLEYNGKNVTKTSFSYGKGNWRFYIDLLNYRKKNKGVSYVYFLKGYDQQPRDGSSEYVEYTNLPAGEYTLMVSTRMENGQIAPYKKLVTFTVQTPFWQTWWFITLCFLFTVGIMTGIIVLRIRVLNQREAKRNDLLRQIAESQVVALRAQMNPHFIFNAINSIQDFVLQNETEDAYSYLSKFARLIRLVMHQSNNNFLSLEQEIDWLKIYMELEQLRFQGKFEFELFVDPELEVDTLIPNMLIQPHLENAIWHGIIPLRGQRPGKIRLSFIKGEKNLRVEIEDNGVGRGNAPEKRDHESSGIKLVTDRLERLSKLENTQFRQEIIDLKSELGEATGTLVLLYIDRMD